MNDLDTSNIQESASLNPPLSTLAAAAPERSPSGEAGAPASHIAIIGLGYVGLPLARLFATKYPVVGFDINESRVAELRSGTDSTLEVTDDLLQSVLLPENPFPATPQLAARNTEPATSNPQPATRNPQPATSTGLFCTTSLSEIADANIYIITVPTPVDKNNRPVLAPLVKASETVGKVLKKGDVVIYESTVYPGATEEDCIPVLEKVSGLKFNQDFFAGYSPERINPGDKEHTVEKIKKVTSGSTPEIGRIVDDLYSSVITAGTHLAPTIKVAEAAKVIENSQRDINIAFVNELAKIFNLMDIDTHAVLEAAGTKWNFLPFRPGLVGGHCIGVDPYYLAQKAQEYGYHPEIILAGRRLNDSMGKYVAEQVLKTMIAKGINPCGAKVLNLGITFKENCPDVRNTKAVDVIRNLESFGLEVTTYDPWANPEEVMHEYGIVSHANLQIRECANAQISESTNTQISESANPHKYDAIVLTVAHNEFKEMDLDSYVKEGGVVYDVKGILTETDAKL